MSWWQRRFAKRKKASPPSAGEEPAGRTLQERAKAFLERPVPEGMAYVPDSLSERFIASYATEGKLDLGPDMAELLQICALEAENLAAKESCEVQAYFQESGAILKAILAEM